MAGNDKKTSPATAAKEKAAPKTEASTPSNYSRGEGQKPVSQAYKDNWNAIFGKKAGKKAGKKSSKKKRR